MPSARSSPEAPTADASPSMNSCQYLPVLTSKPNASPVNGEVMVFSNVPYSLSLASYCRPMAPNAAAEASHALGCAPSSNGTAQVACPQKVSTPFASGPITLTRA